MSSKGTDKVALGTAQFGMEYGINNKRGRINQPQVRAILNKAVECGIDTFDTAYDYGESERVLGDFIKSCHKRIKIISKLPVCESNAVKKILKSSLDRLGISKIYGYLIHNFNHYKNECGIWNELKRIRDEDKIEKIGFSLYFPSELEFLFEHGLEIDLVQVPFSVFDQRFEPYFPELKKRKVEIFVRSVFLQGILFKKPSELDDYFETIKDKIKRLNTLSRESRISIVSLCLNFVLENKFIDKVVVGIDNLAHLKEVVSSVAPIPNFKDTLDELSDLREDNEDIILPFKWELKRVNAL